MTIEDTFIKGLKIIRLNRLLDERGEFQKVFNEDFFLANGLSSDFKENYFSVSRKGVIRGMHFQIPPFDLDKLVYVTHGSIIDVILDLRKSSETYGRHFHLELNRDNPVALYIPRGCANGHVSLEDNTIVSYLQTKCYNRKYDYGVKFDSFGMNWEINNPIISQRDKLLIEFNKYESHF